jgi:Lon protease-like protein
LGGVCRFKVEAELSTTTPYRQCRIQAHDFIADLTPALGEAEVKRDNLLETLKRYLQANNMDADWEGIANASTELLVNALSAMCPFGAREKQALLEAVLLKDRAETLIALTEFSLAGDDSAHHIQ